MVLEHADGAMAEAALLTGFDERSDEFFNQIQPMLGADPQRALAVARAAQARAQARGDMLGVVRGLLAQGTAHNALGQAERDEVFAQALQLAQAEADPVLLVRAVSSQIFVDIYHGRYSDALWRGQSILGMAHALRRNDLLVRLTLNIGTALNLIGEHELAIPMFAECAELLQGDGEAVRQQRLRTDNNRAMAWLGIARVASQDGTFALAAADALSRARALAEGACEGALRERHGELRAGSLDTLVGVLLEMGEVDEARRWVERVCAESGELLLPGSAAWGIAALAQCRAELAQPGSDVAGVVQRLRAVEALPGPLFRGGELNATLNHCLAAGLSRLGLHREALGYHRQWLQAEARTQSLLAREHALAVHRTMESLRGETEEFITHDLRNPLGAALVQLGSAPESSAPRIAQARGQVQQAFDTAERYLVVLRTRHLRRADLKPIDLAELVDDVGERLAPPSGAAVRLERELGWGLQMRADRIVLLMALQELLRAALASAAAGTAVCWNLSAADGRALLVVEGAGPDWARSMAERMRLPGAQGAQDERDMAALMLARVAQLHDSRLDLLPGPAGSGRVEWRFPLAAEP
jgi:tetratricopeptide (TPR) repeat protein